MAGARLVACVAVGLLLLAEGRGADRGRLEREACQRRFRRTDFALEGFKSGYMETENLTAFVDCLYALRTKNRAPEKVVHVGGIHYPTLLTTNHLSPPVSTSSQQWCWLDNRGVGPSGLSAKTCCDTSKGPEGLAACWDGHFTFDLCCRGGVHIAELPHFFVAPAFDINVGSAVRQVGTFDLGQSYALQTLCRPGDTVVDVGANVGGFTVPLAERVGPTGRVHAFEPFRKIFQHLTANVALNGLSNVWTYNNALGEETKEIDIHAPDLTSWNFPSAIRVAEQFEPEDAVTKANLRYEAEKERISVRPLDSFHLSGRLSLIKIDVEFMELHVVRGAKETIRRHQPVLWVENEPFFDEPPNRTFVETMQSEFDYRCQVVARLELLCTPASAAALPAGFQRVLRHLSGQVSDKALWRAMSEVDPDFSASEIR